MSMKDDTHKTRQKEKIRKERKGKKRNKRKECNESWLSWLKRDGQRACPIMRLVLCRGFVWAPCHINMWNDSRGFGKHLARLQSHPPMESDFRMSALPPLSTLSTTSRHYCSGWCSELSVDSRPLRHRPDCPHSAGCDATALWKVGFYLRAFSYFHPW